MPAMSWEEENNRLEYQLTKVVNHAYIFGDFAVTVQVVQRERKLQRLGLLAVLQRHVAGELLKKRDRQTNARSFHAPLVTTTVLTIR